MRSLTDVLAEISASSPLGEVYSSVDIRGYAGDQPLHLAAIWNNIEFIKVLVKNRADIDSGGEDGFTPLHYAVEQNNFEAVKELVSLGAGDMLNDFGANAKEIAHVLKYPEIFKFLDDNGF